MTRRRHSAVIAGVSSDSLANSRSQRLSSASAKATGKPRPFLPFQAKSIDPDRAIFARLHALAKKHHTLALFSTVRLHQVQSAMNLPQVFEAGAAAAFAIANPEHRHFVKMDKRET